MAKLVDRVYSRYLFTYLKEKYYENEKSLNLTIQIVIANKRHNSKMSTEQHTSIIESSSFFRFLVVILFVLLFAFDAGSASKLCPLTSSSHSLRIPFFLKRINDLLTKNRKK